jgi:hypothetical protein
MFVKLSTQHFQIDGLAGTDQSHGPLDHQTLLRWIFSVGLHKRFVLPVVPDINNLRERIASAIATVTPQMLEKVWGEYEYRLDILRATKGAHVEVY